MRMPPFGGGMPQFMFLPWGGGPEHHHDHNAPPDIIVPARINKAMEFLQLLSSKTMKRAAASDSSVIEIDGQTLSEEELNAQATACDLLSKYFAGKLQPDVWERLRYDALEQRVKTGGREGMVIRCIGCQHSPMPNPSCELCKGSGKVIVMPMISEPSMTTEQIMGFAPPGDDGDGQ